MPLAPGDVFAGYTILRQLGSGGMGSVYLVRHPRLPRHDALKLLNRELSSEPDFVARFMREADIVSSLSHRNIVSIYDRGEEAGQLWLTMRYVDGIDGEAALAEAGGLFPAPRAVHIISEVAAALDAAHRRQLIHRDVKPANILLCASDDDESEQVFLTDFGIAKSLDASSRLTRTGLVVATFDYASPEQIEARPLDSRSDVYSLGCVLYKLLTGSVPFPGEMMLAAAAGHLGQPPPKPTQLAPWLPPALDDVVTKAMAKEPADRYPTCRALAAAAAAAMDDFPEAPRPPYRVFLSRTVNSAGSGQHLGPMRTDSLSQQETERLVGLVRRTRFFDLPENLAASAPVERQVTIEIGCTGRAHRVIADLGTPRRPPEMDDLVAEIERMSLRTAAPQPVPIAVPVPAPPPPTQRTTPQRRDTPVVGSAAPPTTGGRFAQPPPPLPAPPQSRPVREPHEAPSGQPAGAPPGYLSGAPAEHPSGPIWTPPGPPPGFQPPGSQPPGSQPPGSQPPGSQPGGYQPGPGGPGLPPPPPWQVPDGGRPAQRRSGRWTAIIAAIVAVLVAAGITTYLLTRGEPPGGGSNNDSGGSGSSSSAAPTTPPTAQAEAAYKALPRTGALPDTTMVVSRLVDGNVDLYLLDGTTGAVGQRLTSDPNDDVGAILSPDRRTIIYLRDPDSAPAELRTMAIDGKADRPLFSSPLDGCANPGRPAWSKAVPEQIALACYDDPERTTLRLVSFDGVTIRDLPVGRARIDDLTFSPDGTRVAFWGGGQDSAAGAIFTVSADGQSDPVQLTHSGVDNDVVWSPDGDKLAFSRVVATGKRQIVVMAPEEGAKEQPITSGDHLDQGPSWSPDGSHIAYKTNQPTESGASGDHWWVMNADGSEQKALETDGKAVASPAWGSR